LLRDYFRTDDRKGGSESRATGGHPSSFVPVYLA